MLELIARKSELIVSFCAMITSVISLFIAYKAQVHQQKHNQLSVKPLAEFLIGDYEDVIFIKIKNHLIIHENEIISLCDPRLVFQNINNRRSLEEARRQVLGLNTFHIMEE